MATYTVTTNLDEAAGSSLAEDLADGDGLSLREAVRWASSLDTILFEAALAGTTLVLTEGPLSIAKDLTIDGDINGDDKADITLSGDANGNGIADSGDSRIFVISGSADVDLKSLTLTNGFTSGNGGALYAASGTTVSLTDSTIEQSSANLAGGGLAIRGTFTATNITLSGNTTNGNGGGIAIAGSGDVTLTNATIDGNTAGTGGGIALTSGTSLALYHGTVTDNTATSGGGILNDSSTLTVFNSVLAGNSGGYISTTGVGPSTSLSFSQQLADAGLAPLADNGGTVATRAIEPDSPLINTGSNGNIPSGLATDANGNPRLVGDTVDVGATEFQLVVTTANDDAVSGSLATDLIDGGGLSLREAIAHAEGGDTITFDESLAGATLVLTQGSLALTKSITIDGDINGDDRADITISGDSNGNGIFDGADTRIFDVSGSAYATLRSLTLTHGYANNGGAVSVLSGATLKVDDSTIENSRAVDHGGGILVTGGTLLMTNSTFTGNSSGVGAAVSTTGHATLTNVTVDGNTDSIGGAIYVVVGGVLTFRNGTITDNIGNGIDNISASVTLTNSVVAGNSVAQISGSYSNNDSLVTSDASSLLSPLADNGGPVDTRMPIAGSALVNAYDNSFIAATGNVIDANGNPRIAGGTVDLGAVELQLKVTTTGDETVGASLAADMTDGGGLSLREAVAWAESGDTITFDRSLAGATLVLTQGSDISIDRSITIDGDVNGDDKADVTLSGNDTSRIFNIITGATDVVLQSLNLTDGLTAGSYGGAVRVNSSSAALTIIDSTIANNTAGTGGGGIYSKGTLSVVNSTISGNHAASYGGGITMASGTALSVVNSTITGNSVTNHGGGIMVANTVDLTIRDSTIVGNSAGGNTGGVRFYSGTTATITNSVIAQNTGNNGADIGNGGIGGALIAGNDFFGTTVTIDTDLGDNINGGGNPRLGQLLDNGGTVLTFSPLDGSPLISAGNRTFLRADLADIDGDGSTVDLLPQDGRGGARSVGTLDIGAVEKITNEKITGTAAANIILGGTGSDTLSGLAGNDTLNGGSGRDVLKGGTGNDTYIVDDTRDKVSEAGGGGQADLVKASASFTLGSGLEDLILTGHGNIKAVGNGLANDLTGNSGNNLLQGKGGGDVLTGGGGNDTLDGGNGRDVMNGGSGNDQFLVDDTRDKVVGGNGHDLVTASVNFVLGNDTEELIFTGRGNLRGIGNNRDNAITGNAGGNELVGNDGRDTLTGGGGNDTLIGGAGNDRLDGDGGNDVAVYSGTVNRYSFRELANGTVKVIDHNGALGTDILSDIEFVKIGGATFHLHDLLA